MNTIFLQLGSNMGEREQYLQNAIALIVEKIGAIQEKSKVYESVPWGVESQNNYLNQVLQIRSRFSPDKVLEKVLKIEDEIGRIRNEKWGERIIDIDNEWLMDLEQIYALLFSHFAIKESGLIVEKKTRGFSAELERNLSTTTKTLIFYASTLISPRCDTNIF